MMSLLTAQVRDTNNSILRYGQCCEGLCEVSDKPWRRKNVYIHNLAPSASVKNCFRTLSLQDENVTDALAALNDRYRASLPEKRSAILSAFSAWRADAAQLEPLRELARLLHKLAGSAGGYGFTPLGDSARAADGLIHEWLSDAPADLAERQAFVVVIEPLMRVIEDLFKAGINHVGADTSAALPPLKALLVDDDEELRLLLTEQMRVQGIELHAVADAAGMSQLLERGRWDVLVLDFWLRSETGDQLARMVRGLPVHATLPIVCLTSDRTPEVRQRTLSAGALEVIDKATPPTQLAGLLRMFARRGR
jgi:CheY-like chemotaxis protein